MNQIWVGLIAIAVTVTAGFIILLIIELKKTVHSLRDFIVTTEETIKPTMEEIQQTLKSIRSVSDDVNSITSNIKELSGTVRDVGQNISVVSNLIGDITSSTKATASGLKVGIKTALGVLLKNLFTKKGG
ncbi:MAG: hypothetical protein A2Y97_00665 [Nitrospirae bacterium RBG_13_39_12]|nr:MAG: hypothetical protein A2Y97_00665 [Nitrospirae bacterium RBG_13_39_12]